MALIDFDIDDGVLLSYTGTESNVVIPDGVIEISKKAFQSSNNIKKLTIPTTVKKIGQQAFDNCINLYEIYFDAENCEEIGDGAFNLTGSNSNGLSLIFGSTVQSLPKIIVKKSYYPENYNVKFNKIVFEDISNLQNIYAGCITATTNIEDITGKGDGKYYVKSGCIMEASTGTLVLGCATSVIPEETQIIASYAFFCRSISDELELPDDIKEIQDFAFNSCDGVVSLQMPRSLQKIGNFAFSYCDKLKKVKFNKNLVEIGQEAFESCKKLSGEITIPASVVKIGSGAFCETNLDSIILEEGVKRIETSAFALNDNLTNLVIPSSVNYVEPLILQDTNCATIHVYAKKPFLGLPKGWSGKWKALSTSKVVWGK